MTAEDESTPAMGNSSDIQEQRGLDANAVDLLTEAHPAEDGQSAETLPPPEATETGTAGPDQAFDSHEAIQTLDDELAGLADDLLGDASSDEPEHTAASFTPAMPAVAALQPEAYRPRPPEPPPVDAPPDDPPPAGADEDESPAIACATVPKVQRRALRHIEAWVYSRLALLSSPLAARPAQVRIAIGWIAAFNTFLAACLWVYVLFLRAPEAPPPRAAPAAQSPAPAAKPAKTGGH